MGEGDYIYLLVASQQPHNARVPTDEQLIRRLQGWRNRPTRDDTMEGAFGALTKDLKRQARAVGGISSAWIEVIPPALAVHASLVGVSRGVLTVRVADATAKFELDRWLRCGGETKLIQAAQAPLVRVRLVM